MIPFFSSSARPASSPLTGRSLWQRHGGAPSLDGSPEADHSASPGKPPAPLPARIDFAVVGGGLAGLSTALALSEAEPDAAVALFEARFIGFGASGRNAGLLSPLPAPLWLASAGGNAEHLWGLTHLNLRGREIAQWLAAEAPGSGVEPKTLRIEAQGHLTATGLSRVARLLGQAGIDYRAAAGPRGHFAIDLDTNAVDPYRTVRALGDIARSRGITIHEAAPVRGLDETPDAVRIVLADGRETLARAAVVCTNAYSASLTLPEPVKAKVVYNFMVATDPVRPELIGASGSDRRFVVELNTSYVFYRVHQGRIVYGGIERVKPYGQNDFAVPPDVLAGLEKLLARSFPNAAPRPAEAWGGVYHQTATDLPIIKRTGTRGAIVLNAGYGGTGVAMTMTCGRLAAALARGERFAVPEDKRLYAALASTRMPLAGLARFVAGVATDVLTLRRPQ